MPLHLNFKDPKVLIGLGVGALALWWFFLKPPSGSNQAASTGTATQASDQGAQQGYPAQAGSDQGGGSGGGAAGAVDLSGIVDALLAQTAGTHAYDLSFLAGLQQSDLSYLGSFSSSFLGYAADVNQEFAGLTAQSIADNNALISQLLSASQAGAVPTGSAGGGVVIPTGAAAQARATSTTNQPRQFAQPAGTFPTPQTSPRAAAALGSVPILGAVVGVAGGASASRPVFPIVHSPPVVPAVHQQGGVHGPAMD